MPLQGLSLQNFRLYDQAELVPDPKINLITGGNACGKTTLLEAIHTLSCGRSFRTNQAQNLARHGGEEWLVQGDVANSGGSSSTHLLVRQGKLGREMAVGPNRGARQPELAQYLPLLVISPDSHFEFFQHPKARRSVLDWLLFHVEPSYHLLWVRYQRALTQRNAAIKDPRQAKVRFSWDEELASLGDAIQRMRDAQLEEFRADFEAITAELVGDGLPSELYLRPGWNREVGMTQSLLADRARDLARGFTHSGPHRNDLESRVSGRLSQEQASHGQNKLLVIALRLAQILKLHSLCGKQCALLIDDLPAELDTERRARLSSFFSRVPAQVFVTATDARLIASDSWPSFRRFHVERGRVAVVE